MKKIILIGKTYSGKTTLCQKIHDISMEYKKTQAIEVYDNAIDTPGEYIENRFYYKALIVTAVDADAIVLIKDCTEEENFFPPGFASIFAKDVIGIVTKIDLAKSENDILDAEENLKLAGTEKIYRISSKTGEGIEELISYLNK